MRKTYLKRVRTDKALGIDEQGVISEFDNPIFVAVKGKSDFTLWLGTLQPVIRSITRLADFKLLYWIGENIKYNEGIICLNKFFKENAAKQMDISVSAIDKSISVLKENQVLLPFPGAARSAVFRVNPACLWKGSTRVREAKEKDFLEEIRLSNLPDKEKQAQIQIERYRHSMQFEQNPSAVFDFRRIGIPAA